MFGKFFKFIKKIYLKKLIGKFNKQIVREILNILLNITWIRLWRMSRVVRPSIP